MMIDYNYGMVKDFEAGWAKFQRQEARREKVRKIIGAIGRWLTLAAYAAATVAVIVGLGVMVWASMLLQPWEVGL